MAKVIAFLLASLIPLRVQGQALSAGKQDEFVTTASLQRLSIVSDPSERMRAEIGLPFSSKHFAAQDYEQHYQNWEIVQDNRGIIYVANHDGVLEYDGNNWRLIPTLTNTTARSLALSDSTLYVGAQGDFGYLQADSVGVEHYVSLIDEVPMRARNFEDVWGTHVTAGDVYFQTKDRLFQWNGERIKSWKSRGKGFHTSFVVRNHLYVRETEKGLLRLENDSLHMMPGGERFAQNSVYMMAPYGDDKMLVGTSKEGLFLYDGRRFTSFHTEADAFLKEHQLYSGSVLPGGRFALTTLGGGAVVIDKEGRIVQVLNRQSGLPGNYVTSASPGRQGGLWMTFGNSGLARVDLRPQLSRFDQRLGLEGIVYQITRYQGALYVATGTGVYRLKREKMVPLQQQRARFERVPGVLQAWDLATTTDGLLAAGEKGVYLIHDGTGERISETPTYKLTHSSHTPNRIYAGTKSGLRVLENKRGEWNMMSVGRPKSKIRSLVETGEDTLWVSTRRGKVMRVRLSNVSQALPEQVTYYNTSNGLPRGEVMVGELNHEPVFYTSASGFYRMRPSSSGKEKFYPDTTFGTVHEKPASPFLAFAADSQNNVWLVYRDRVKVALQKPDGSYTCAAPPALQFPKGVTRIYVEEGNVVWISDGNELIRYQPRGKIEKQTYFPVMVRKVKALGSNEVVFGGSERPSEDQHETKLGYAHNSLQFAFTAPDYQRTVQNEYQYRLKGEERSWSEWTTQPKKTFASLGPGHYRFEVRSRNNYVPKVTTAGFSFHILAPWYRTWLAYGAYLALCLLLGTAYMRYRRLLAASRQAEQQAHELKRERKLSRRLQHANERLEEANRLKDELLSNTSHELRTPLTSIKGFTDVLKEEVAEEHHEFLEYIDANTKRLTQTVNALLSLAQLRSGSTEASRETVALGAQAAEIVSSLRSQAQEKNITIQLERHDPDVQIMADAEHLHQVIHNLVTNAIKFTDEGSVTVRVERFEEEAYLEVRDTGIGISDEFMPYLFKDFKQESKGLARSYEGSGLGLSITAKLVELMGGSISVESEKGQGSTFTVTFPLQHPEYSA